MRLCIDEAGFHLAADAVARTHGLEEFGLFLASCHDAGHTVERYSDLFEQRVSSDEVALYQLLYEASHGIDREVRQLVGQALNRCVVWDDADDLPDPMDVHVGTEELAAMSIAHAHARATDRHAIALIQTGSARRGRLPVARDGVVHALHFVADQADLTAFYRDVPEIEDMDAESYLSFAPIPFPAIHFTTGLAAQTRRFSRPFRDLRAVVTVHLAALNDWFRQVHEDCANDTVRTQAEFRARCGIDASPESGNTKANAAAWRQRLIVVQGQELHCSWHTKIEPNRDRIHFHPGRHEVAEGRLIVGIFHEHLDT